MITLQDVAVLFELMIDAPPVTGSDDKDWTVEYERFLGVVPLDDGSEGWCIEADVAPRAVTQDPLTDVQGQKHARAYIFDMISITMFLDYCTNRVQFRWLPLLENFDACGAMFWGSVMLTYLYMEPFKVTSSRVHSSGNTTLRQIIQVKYLIYASIILITYMLVI